MTVNASHDTSHPQLQDPAPLHTWTFGHSSSGSRPMPMFPHVPSVPEPFFTAVQAWHVPTQAVLQQTPSTQKPLAQSRGELQMPFGR